MKHSNHEKTWHGFIMNDDLDFIIIAIVASNYFLDFQDFHI